MIDGFFSEIADQSEVKARIVSNYFVAWARIIAPRTMLSDGKLAYIDLFAGPGRYEDGSASTPIMILSKAIEIPKLRDGLVSIFNDADENHTATLSSEIAKISGIKTLKYAPDIWVGEIDRAAAEYFKKVRLIPTFSFIDPFGYKGLSSALIRSVIKDWGSDCVFFFNYSRINAGVSNHKVFPHMRALFGGEENFEQLRNGLARSQASRERLIMDHLAIAMKEAGAKHVISFRFRKGGRTTHHLVFVTKHPTGYEIMKEVMAAESSNTDQGVPSFEYAPILAGVHKLFETALDNLENELTATFAGQSLSMIAIYHRHNLDTPYVKKNYKEALLNLEKARRISVDRPNRPAGTFGDNVVVTFPQPVVPRT